MPAMASRVPATRLLLLLILSAPVLAQTVSVPPAGQTVPFAGNLISSGDTAVWVHPSDVTQSVILGVDGQTGLYGFDLSGAALQAPVPGSFTSVDVRYL